MEQNTRFPSDLKLIQGDKGKSKRVAPGPRDLTPPAIFEATPKATTALTIASPDPTPEPVSGPVRIDDSSSRPYRDREREKVKALLGAHPHRFFVRHGAIVEREDAKLRQLPWGRLDAIGARVIERFHWGKGENDEKEYKRRAPAQPTQQEIRRIHAAPDGLFPALLAVMAAPVLCTIDDVHSLAAKTGYYPALSRYLFLPEGIFIGSKGDAVNALDLLLGDFPFRGLYDWFGAVALAVLAFLRLIEAPVPMTLVEAPEMRSGKSTLAEILLALFLGRIPDACVWPDNAHEVHYSIASYLAEDLSVLFLDNIGDGTTMASPVLEALLTAEGIYKLRQAGHGEPIAADPKTLTVVGTGNRIKLAGGLSRRVVQIHLQQPKMTRYRIPSIRRWVLKNRPALLSALLAIVDEWVARGMPGPNRAFPSYPLWSYAVGGCVAIAAEWMGVGSMRDVEAWMRSLGDQRSDEQSAFSELFQAWSRDQNGNVVLIASGQVLGIIEQAGITFFQELLAGRNPKTHAQVIGNLLTGFWKSKREVDGLHLHRQNSSCTLYVPVPVQGGGA